jgi:hypothetical protein
MKARNPTIGTILHLKGMQKNHNPIPMTPNLVRLTRGHAAAENLVRVLEHCPLLQIMATLMFHIRRYTVGNKLLKDLHQSQTQERN